jgi:hypothetical protein
VAIPLVSDYNSYTPIEEWPVGRVAGVSLLAMSVGKYKRRFKIKVGEHNWYKEQVVKDPGFLSELKQIANERAHSFPNHNSQVIRNRIVTLATDYDLSVEDVDELLVTVIGDGPVKNNKGYIGFDLFTRQASVNYSIDDCSDTEARELWEKSLAARRRDFGKPKASKRRLPDDPELLYAVHRAVADGLHRQAIHELYKAGELASYKADRSEYLTPGELMAYYFKHTERR